MFLLSLREVIISIFLFKCSNFSYPLPTQPAPAPERLEGDPRTEHLCGCPHHAGSKMSMREPTAQLTAWALSRPPPSCAQEGLSRWVSVEPGDLFRTFSTRFPRKSLSFKMNSNYFAQKTEAHLHQHLAHLKGCCYPAPPIPEPLAGRKWK